MPAGNSNSIYERNRKAAKDNETLLWRALCDDPATAIDYIEPDCVIVNPLIHPDKSPEALTAKSSPSLSEALEKLAQSSHAWTSYKIHKHNPEPAIAEVEMMAVQIIYRISLFRERRHRHGGGEGEEGGEGANLQTVEAFCTSTWRQGASGDWKLCAQSLVPV
ncbi:hypothetical protein SLS53_001144 [Cytospora paraplurivora]|uniref:DUF4440 domain-containing protein n=1 Tax=Cytospora paraplurivora TaxID=2898453 RepID=A0AAN9UHP4_9PEZI